MYATLDEQKRRHLIERSSVMLPNESPNLDKHLKQYNTVVKSASECVVAGKVPRQDDVIVALQGSLDPWILRPQQEQGHSYFEFIGVIDDEYYRLGDRHRWGGELITARQRVLAAAAQADLLEIFEVA